MVFNLFYFPYGEKFTFLMLEGDTTYGCSC